MKQVRYKGKNWNVEKEEGNYVWINDGEGVKICCPKSELDPFEGYFLEELDFTRDSDSRRKIEKKVKKFFQKLIRVSWPPKKKMILLVRCSDRIAGRLILDALNHYGIYGAVGLANIHYEWEFSNATKADKDAHEEFTLRESDFHFYMHDIGAKGRHAYYQAMEGKKICWFVGRVIDHRERYRQSVS